MQSIFQVTLQQILGGTLLLAILLASFRWLLSTWISARVDKSIQHEYEKKIEDYKFVQLQREKAELVGRFFAKWIKFCGKEQQILSPFELLSYYEELNSMSFELSLWLKDETVLKDIMDRLLLKPGAPDIATVITKIRKIILDKPGDSFDPNDIIFWGSRSDEIVNKIVSERLVSTQ